MRKALFVLLMMGLVASCSKKSEYELLELTVDEPAYKLAKEMAADLPFLDPDSHKVLATTDNFKVTWNHVIKKLYDDRGSSVEQIKGMGKERLKRMVLQSAERLADEQLMLAAARQAGIKLDVTQKDSIMNMQFEHVGGKEKFLERLNKSNIALETVEGNVERHIIITQYLDKILADVIQITDADLEKARANSKTATVRHILLMTQGKSDAEKKKIRKKMEGILKKAKGGADFAKLAEQYTDDPGSRKKGGLYENFGPGQMVKPFEDASFTVPIGEISDIVETRYGYHIIKVIDRKEETRPLEEIRGELEIKARKAKQAEKQKAIRDHIQTLREAAGFELVKL